MQEITVEITNYCPNNCVYCSSDAGPKGDQYLTLDQIKSFLGDGFYDRINISGGEPLAHPEFYKILQLCKSKLTETGFVAVYTNELDCIMYNASLKYGVRVEANLPVLPDVNKVHILAVTPQGREAKRPDIHYSCNWETKCDNCSNTVLRPDGSVEKTPCTKNLK